MIECIDNLHSQFPERIPALCKKCCCGSSDENSLAESINSAHSSVSSRASDTERRTHDSDGSAVTNESLGTVPSFSQRTSSKHSLVMAHAKRPDDVLSFYADVEYHQYVAVNKQNVNTSMEFDEYANKQEQYVIDELREYVTNNPQDDLAILHEEEEVGGEGMDDDDNEDDEQTKKDERTDIVYEGNVNDGDISVGMSMSLSHLTTQLQKDIEKHEKAGRIEYEESGDVSQYANEYQPHYFY